MQYPVLREVEPRALVAEVTALLPEVVGRVEGAALLPPIERATVAAADCSTAPLPSLPVVMFSN